ncbi:hypothetical protein [Rhodoplanes roseus]|uniref:Uncharacterized protein n=1 Tax=Rhodoplanes roseus TaxID=29409 RepID=A0A327K7N4_9BRAD|nr:hypothetical protein [Rhodoplanes roseus]RAI34730.1 hypothetical protein CH341_31255 [Rhodoplanes roseus]
MADADVLILPVIRIDRYGDRPVDQPPAPVQGRRRAKAPPIPSEDWAAMADGLLVRFSRQWAGDAALSVTELARVAHRLGALDDAALARNRAPLAALRRLLEEAVRRADHHAEECRQARRAAAEHTAESLAEAEEASPDRARSDHD